MIRQSFRDVEALLREEFESDEQIYLNLAEEEQQDTSGEVMAVTQEKDSCSNRLWRSQKCGASFSDA